MEGIGTMMAEQVIVNGNGAVLTSDAEAGGYYLVSWDSPPYTLQEDILTKYDPQVHHGSTESTSCPKLVPLLPATGTHRRK